MAAAVAGFDVIQPRNSRLTTSPRWCSGSQQWPIEAPRPSSPPPAASTPAMPQPMRGAGADVLVTSAPYLAKPKDVQVRIAAAGVKAPGLIEVA